MAVLETVLLTSVGDQAAQYGGICSLLLQATKWTQQVSVTIVQNGAMSHKTVIFV
jgi:hypothetical protein